MCTSLYVYMCICICSAYTCNIHMCSHNRCRHTCIWYTYTHVHVYCISCAPNTFWECLWSPRTNPKYSLRSVGSWYLHVCPCIHIYIYIRISCLYKYYILYIYSYWSFCFGWVDLDLFPSCLALAAGDVRKASRLWPHSSAVSIQW